MSIIYDSADFDLLKLGPAVPFTNSPEKKLYNVTYNDNDFIFSFKNKYYEIDEVHTNNYDKKYIEIKSVKFNEFVKKIAKHFGCTTIDTGIIRVNITPSTSIHGLNSSDKKELKDVRILLSVAIPTIYEDESIKTLQITAREIVILEKIPNKTLEFDVQKLELNE